MGDTSAQYTVHRPSDGVRVIEVVDPAILGDGKGPLYGLAARDPAQKGRELVLLGLGNVKAINSAAIGVLVNLEKRIREARGVLVLCDVDPYVADVLRLTKVDQVLEIGGTQAEVIEAHRARKAGGSPPSGGGERGWFSKLFGG